MEMKYPRYDIYEIMYKKYFKRSPEELIEYAELKQGACVADLCAGNGRLTFLLKEKGMGVLYVDREKDMTPVEELNKRSITYLNKDIEDFVKYPAPVNYDGDSYAVGFDAIFCQQAITYWFNTTDLSELAKMLKRGGKLVFNTFNKKPSTVPMQKEYSIDGLDYIEISYLVYNKVYHVQCCEGYEPHFTVFDWISREEFLEKLKPYFDVREIINNNTSIYVCTKK